MTVKVPDSVIEKTTKCKKNFECLKDGECGHPEYCKVHYPNGPHVLFLASKKSIDCPYRVPFGDSVVCRCPVHYAIYHQAKRAE